MSGFDHDASGQRGVVRQDIVDRELHELFRLLDNTSSAASPGREQFLAIELLKIFGAPMHRTLAEPHLSGMVAAAGVAERHLRRAAKSNEEYNYMVLCLAKKMLDTATSRIVTDFVAWESRTFREGAPAT